MGSVAIMPDQRINVSIGTVGVLGLADVLMETAPTTAYLMVGGRCAMNCAFCAQARESTASALKLSRVTWPEYDLDSVVAGLVAAARSGAIRRACIQATVARDSFAQTMEVVRAIKSRLADLPVNAAILPDDVEQAGELLAAGLDHIGIGLDAASREAFEQVKGRHWERMWSLIEGLAAKYPRRVSVHIIVGLGETEQDVVQVMQRCEDLGVTVGLFAFTPLAGTPLSDRAQPHLDVYRRMQVARYLICVKGLRAERFRFSPHGELVAFGVDDLAEVLAGGEAFRTSGCPDCNRPFYNERPGGVIYNYPRPLTDAETAQAIASLAASVGRVLR